MYRLIIALTFAKLQNPLQTYMQCIITNMTVGARESQPEISLKINRMMHLLAILANQLNNHFDNYNTNCSAAIRKSIADDQQLVQIHVVLVRSC